MNNHCHTSIVICTHNMRTLLRSAILSALAQRATGFEILVLDDGSDDGTWDDLSNFRNHPKIQIFRNERRLGLAKCRNFLLEQAKGQYISILDADDIIAPHKVNMHREILDVNPRVGVVWGRSLIVPMDSEQKKVRLIPTQDFIPGWDLATPYFVAHSATTWRKSILEEVGGYDPKWSLVEGVDLFLKVGDHYQQSFEPSLVSLKRVFQKNDFRCELADLGEALSDALVYTTIRRRYGTQIDLQAMRARKLS